MDGGQRGIDLEDYLYDVEIARRVERDKLEQIYKASISLKKNLKNQGRCRICTLMPPCNHTNMHAFE